MDTGLDIVVVVIDYKLTPKLLNAVEHLGISGSTILPGRGRSADSKTFLFGIPIEPQRECVIFLVPKSKTEEVFQTAMEVGELNKPERGVVFVMDVKQVGGLSLPPTSATTAPLLETT